jgi:hypothetical protein
MQFYLQVGIGRSEYSRSGFISFFSFILLSYLLHCNLLLIPIRLEITRPRFSFCAILIHRDYFSEDFSLKSLWAPQKKRASLDYQQMRNFLTIRTYCQMKMIVSMTTTQTKIGLVIMIRINQKNESNSNERKNNHSCEDTASRLRWPKPWASEIM